MDRRREFAISLEELAHKLRGLGPGGGRAAAVREVAWLTRAGELLEQAAAEGALPRELMPAIDRYRVATSGIAGEATSSLARHPLNLFGFVVVELCRLLPCPHAPGPIVAAAIAGDDRKILLEAWHEENVALGAWACAAMARLLTGGGAAQLAIGALDALDIEILELLAKERSSVTKTLIADELGPDRRTIAEHVERLIALGYVASRGKRKGVSATPLGLDMLVTTRRTNPAIAPH